MALSPRTRLPSGLHFPQAPPGTPVEGCQRVSYRAPPLRKSTPRELLEPPSRQDKLRLSRRLPDTRPEESQMSFKSAGEDRNPIATPNSSTGCYRRRPRSLFALRGVNVSRTPELCEILFVKLYQKPHTRAAEEIEKLDAGQPEHLGRFARSDALLGIEF